MTRRQLKAKIATLESYWFGIGRYGSDQDPQPSHVADRETAERLRNEIFAQIDLMYQGAADDESFDGRCPPGCTGSRCHCQSCGETGVPLNEDGYCHGCSCIELTPDNCSYCGDEMNADNLMHHKDGDCLEDKILLRDGLLDLGTID